MSAYTVYKREVEGHSDRLRERGREGGKEREKEAGGLKEINNREKEQEKEK